MTAKISAILLIRFVLDNNLYYGKIVPEVLFYSLFAILIMSKATLFAWGSW